MILTPEQKSTIKSSSEIYRREVMQINAWIDEENDQKKLDQLYLLRTISTIEHAERIGLFDDKNSEHLLEEISQEVDQHFPEREEDDLYDDLSVLEDALRDRLFTNPAKEKEMLLKSLKLTL